MPQPKPPIRAITCPRFVAIAGTRRCREYLSNGGCKRPDEFMCVEWLKLNGPGAPGALSNTPPSTEPTPVERDLFGAPVHNLLPRQRGPSSPGAGAAAPIAAPLPRPAGPPPPTDHALPLIRSVNEADVASFRDRGVEVCLESEALGEIWLVPAYTGQARQELTIQHAALLAAVGAVFPEAKVTALRRPEGRSVSEKK